MAASVPVRAHTSRGKRLARTPVCEVPDPNCDACCKSYFDALERHYVQYSDLTRGAQ